MGLPDTSPHVVKISRKKKKIKIASNLTTAAARYLAQNSTFIILVGNQQDVNQPQSCDVTQRRRTYYAPSGWKFASTFANLDYSMKSCRETVDVDSAMSTWLLAGGWHVLAMYPKGPRVYIYLPYWRLTWRYIYHHLVLHSRPARGDYATMYCSRYTS